MGRDGRIAREDPTKVLIFETWYAAGKNFAETRRILLAKDPPVQVSVDTLYRYANKYKWDERASERDLEVAKRLQEEAIEQRTAFLKRTANMGRLLQTKAVTFLNDDKVDPNKPGSGQGGIKSDFAAIQAMKVGLELERFGMGFADQHVAEETHHEVVIRVVRETPQKQLDKKAEAQRRQMLAMRDKILEGSVVESKE